MIIYHTKLFIVKLLIQKYSKTFFKLFSLEKKLIKNYEK